MSLVRYSFSYYHVLRRNKHIDTFNPRLEVGKDGEKIARHYFESVLAQPVEISTGFDRAKDITFLKSGKIAELKTDVYAWKSGQIMIEGQSLKTHTAPSVIYLIPTFYWALRKDLLAWYPRCQDIYQIGDDKREGKPLPISSPMFNEIFKKI